MYKHCTKHKASIITNDLVSTYNMYNQGAYQRYAFLHLALSISELQVNQTEINKIHVALVVSNHLQTEQQKQEKELPSNNLNCK